MRLTGRACVRGSTVEPQGTPEPYQDLHIYLIEGIVSDREEAGFGEHFLGAWVEGDTSFLFFSTPARDRVASLLRTRPELRLSEEHRFTYEAWQGTRLDPVKIGRFLVVPPWNRTGVQGRDVEIILDPGVVFGTGIHPTTADCLRALDFLRERFAFRSVLDLGTGTGILALAAAALGAVEVVAVDLNPLCVKTARRNVGLNHVEKVVDVLEGSAEDFAADSADLVLANIHYDVLNHLVEGEAFRRAPWLIVSGLMRSQGRDIRKKLERCGASIAGEWDGDGTWTTLLASARNHGRLE